MNILHKLREVDGLNAEREEEVRVESWRRAVDQEGSSNAVTNLYKKLFEVELTHVESKKITTIARLEITSHLILQATED
jgi:hypothetical protein